MAAGGDDRIVHLWDVETKEPIVISTFETGSIYSLAFDPEGRLLAVGDDNGVITIWDAISGNLVTTISEIGVNATIQSLAFNTDGRYLASSCDNQIIYIWDLKSSQMMNLIHLNESREKTPHCFLRPIYWQMRPIIMCFYGTYPVGKRLPHIGPVLSVILAQI